MRERAFVIEKEHSAKGLYISDLNNMTIDYFYILYVSLFIFLSRITSHICLFLFVEREPQLVL
jgi:hypothetical protein